MHALVTLLLAATTPETARYVMYVGGVPTGVISTTVTGTNYTYTSTHVFRARTASLTRTLSLTHQMPEVLWLSQPRPTGCRDVIEERSNAPEQVCITHTSSTAMRGRIRATAFDATYADQKLLTFDSAGVHFEASADALEPITALFDDGFSIEGALGTLALEPPVDVHPAPPEFVHGLRFTAHEAETCLDLATRAVTSGVAKSVVLGLVVDNGRAWPHAWVLLGDGTARDPSVDPAHEKPREYLAFPHDAGRRYLELSSGARHLVRHTARTENQLIPIKK